MFRSTVIQAAILGCGLAMASDALAGDYEDTLSSATEKMKAGDHKGASKLLKAASGLAEDLETVATPRQAALVWYLRGANEHLAGDPKDRSMNYWRQALILDNELPWDLNISADGAVQDLFEALRREVRDRPRVDAGVPEALGAARIYVDGVQLESGDSVAEGEHLAQIACPDDAIYGTWTDFAKPLKWFKMCPDGVDTTVVIAAAEEDEWEDFGPAFGGAAAGGMADAPVDVPDATPDAPDVADASADPAPADPAPAAPAPADPAPADPVTAPAADTATASAEPADPAPADPAPAGPADTDPTPASLAPAAGGTPLTGDETDPVMVRRKISWPLLGAAGGAAVASGVVYAMAVSDRAAYDDLQNPDVRTIDDLDGLRTSTNRKVYTSYALGAAAAGLYVAAFIQW